MAPLATRYVRIRVDSKGFESEFRKAVTGPSMSKIGAAAGTDWAKGFLKSAQAHLQKTTLTVKVKPDWSGFNNVPGAPRVRVPGDDDQGAPRAPREQRAPINVDPLLAAFQAEVRRQVAALSRQVTVKVPVTADTEQLRTDLGKQLRDLQDKAKVKVDADAPDRAEFEAGLRAMLTDVQSRVKAHVDVEKPPPVKVELDPLIAQFQAQMRRELSALTKQAVEIPVTPETAGLRRSVALRIAEIERTLKIKVPIDAADTDRFQATLRNQLKDLRNTVNGALGGNGGGGGGLFSQIFAGLGNAVGTLGLQSLSSGFDALSSSASKAATTTASVGSSASNAAGPIVSTTVGVAGLVAVLSALPAIALAGAGAVTALAGALASIPAIGVGVGAIVGTLGIGFMGLGDAFKQTAAGGGGAAKSMSAVRNAIRSVTQAERELEKATKAVDKARVDEIERIDDLNRALRGAVIDEADAVAAVAEAQVALAEAKASGDPNAIGAAERALNRANQALDESRDKVDDLKKDKAKADKDGVEGSDQVQAALERQRDAVERLQAANEALAEAQKSAGGGGAAKELMKLAPAAQEVVDKLKSLKPVFEDLRLSVQQKLFRGVAAELQRLSDTWMPRLKVVLGDYAMSINSLFLGLGASVRKSSFVADITAASDDLRRNMVKIGDAITGPFVDAFGRLARAATPFVDMLGDKIAGLFTHFSDWIKSADESGKLTKFFQDAAYYFDQLWQIGGNLLGIVGDLLGILLDTPSQGGAKDYLAAVNENLINLREWLKDPENQKKIKEWIDRFGELVKNGSELGVWIVEKALPALSDLITKIDEVSDTAERWKNRFKEAKDTVVSVFSTLPIGLGGPLGQVSGQLDGMVGWFNNLRNRLNFTGMFDGVYNAARTALNNAINLFNSLRLGISFSLSGSGASFSGYGKKLAAGGVARATPGGIAATIAEGGKDEAVAPVDVLQDYIRTAVQEANAASAAGPAGDFIFPIYLFPGSQELDRVVVSAAERNRTAIAKVVNGGNKRLGYAG
ncbi:hypothetical protein ACFFX1_55020 [Dactylosporangium sucinum]|uniref:Uncharacterized protein n=1 Tax=Dactylosporangium sucinum TaxID=1424081 RepID=A0A917U2R9_9ACTN|nr:hypothetical protein [Dactylosporangium sucinum]GGM53202.1 hypothetical protein GCM10007977_063560 [Dactylosporangium sucinum]